MNHEEVGVRIVAAVGEAGGGELLDVLTRPEADRAALIGRLSLRADGEWLAELLIDLEEDEPRDCGSWRCCGDLPESASDQAAGPG